jgi:carbonic anhydrase
MRKILTVLGLACMLAAGSGLFADEDSKHAVPGVAPEEAWRMLAQGNERFAGGLVLRPHMDAERLRELSHAQHPWAVVVAASDSRVVPEIIFDQGLGDLFVLRNAGAIVKTEVEVGSIEYAVEKLGARLILVLGNSRSDLMKDAVAGGGQDDKSAAGLMESDLKPALDEAHDKVGGLTGEALMRESTEKNVLYQIKELLKLSPVIADKVEAGKVMVVGGVYHLENSRVEWIGEHPSEHDILEGKKP